MTVAAQTRPVRRESHRILPAHTGGAADEGQRFAEDVAGGLRRTPRCIPPRYFYDDRGSQLFQQIMDLPEYYLTDAEHEILADRAQEILAFAAGRSLNVVDLGAGDGRKSLHLLEHLAATNASFCYVPIDASAFAVEEVARMLQQRLPACHVKGLVGEYFDGLHWLAEHDTTHVNLVLFLGSNIGNFSTTRAQAFATRLRESLRPGDRVLMGFDLWKSPDVLLPAYNDSAGVTRDFNLNLLTRMNRELDADFDLSSFAHHPIVNPSTRAMESYLLSLRQQQVHLRAIDLTVDFEAWEAIHTESSHKYLHRDIDDLARTSGFTSVHQFTDTQQRFVDALWSVPDGPRIVRGVRTA